MENNERVEWYDNPNILTNVIIFFAFFIIIISQAMAVNSDVSGTIMIRNLFNHNATYIAAIIYFILLKTKVGRRNFNLINVVYICLYVLNTVASVFTIFQSFTLSSIISCVLNAIILFYMCYTFLPETRLWSDFNLDKLPIEEVKNDSCFYIICILSIILLLLNLISVTDFHGIVMTMFDTVYIILFNRYIYLYKNYVDLKNTKMLEEIAKKELDVTNKKHKKNKNKKDDSNE